MTDQRKRQNLVRAFDALQRSLSTPIEDERDLAGIIKSFEIVYELSWTMLKHKLEYSGIVTQGPRDAIRKAWQNDMLPVESESTWTDMIRDRNLTVHTYDEGFAREMVTRIRTMYFPAFENLLSIL